MTPARGLLAATAATAALTLGAGAAPALAATHTSSDPTGDQAPRAKRFDITGVRVHNGPRLLRLTVTTRGAGRDKVSTLFRIATPGSDRTQYIVGSDASGHGHRPFFRKFIAPTPSGVDNVPVKCSGFHVDFRPARHQVVVSLPQRCLGAQAGDHRFGASTQTPDGHLADLTRDVRVTQG